MVTAFLGSTAFIPVCRPPGLRLVAFLEGRADRAKKAEGKIKETGTLAGRFLKLSLSAHCLRRAWTAPRSWHRSAAILREGPLFLSFDRHRGYKSPGFRQLRLGMCG